MTRTVARWENRGKFWLELYHNELTGYSYRGDGCGGGLPNNLTIDAEAINYMERPLREDGGGAVTWAKLDFVTLRRVS